jgi:RHS repeat-associated protein
MMMPGRKYSATSSYRYGFNGKENDNEVKSEGNEQDYGMRIYDPRLGRFLSLDPIAEKYPQLTPYQFASNSPIAGSDLDGLEFLPRFIQNDPFSLTTHAFTRTIRKTTAYEVLDGSMHGVAKSFHKTWNFFTSDAYKAETWINTGKFVEEFVFGSAPGVKYETPMINAKIQDFKDKVVNGNAYTRAEYFSELGTDALLAYVGDKGIGGLASLKIFTNTGKTFLSSSIRFTQNTVNDFGKALKSVASGKYDPIDIVAMGDGFYSTVDNTRLLAAQKLGVDIKATVHSFDEALPESMLNRFKNNKTSEYAKTWGQAIEYRVANQSKGYAKTYKGKGSFVQPEAKSN